MAVKNLINESLSFCFEKTVLKYTSEGGLRKKIGGIIFYRDVKVANKIRAKFQDTT